MTIGLFSRNPGNTVTNKFANKKTAGDNKQCRTGYYRWTATTRWRHSCFLNLLPYKKNYTTLDMLQWREKYRSRGRISGLWIDYAIGPTAAQFQRNSYLQAVRLRVGPSDRDCFILIMGGLMVFVQEFLSFNCRTMQSLREALWNWH